MKVKGKRVVITGAASGIGKALAVAFHSAGAAAVMASDINKAGVQAVAAEIKSEGIVTDVTNEEDIIRLIKESNCLLYTSPSPRDRQKSRMPSSA